MESNHAAHRLTLGSLDVASESMPTKDDPKKNTSTAESMDTSTTVSKTATEGSQVSKVILSMQPDGMKLVRLLGA